MRPKRAETDTNPNKGWRGMITIRIVAGNCVTYLDSRLKLVILARVARTGSEEHIEQK